MNKKNFAENYLKLIEDLNKANYNKQQLMEYKQLVRNLYMAIIRKLNGG